MSIKLKRLVIGDAEVNWTDYNGKGHNFSFSQAFFYFKFTSNPSSSLQYSDEFSFSTIWPLQVLSLNGLTQIIGYEITVQNDVFWVHTHLSFCRINLAASSRSHFPFFFSFQPKKHQTVQSSPMVTATSASEAQRRRAVPKTLSPVQTVDAQVGLRWRGWMAGGRRSTVDEIFNFGNTHLVLNNSGSSVAITPKMDGPYQWVFVFVLASYKYVSYTWLLFCFYLEK